MLEMGDRGIQKPKDKKSPVYLTWRQISQRSIGRVWLTGRLGSKKVRGSVWLTWKAGEQEVTRSRFANGEILRQMGEGSMWLTRGQ
jgi:hypothetical protein